MRANCSDIDTGIAEHPGSLSAPAGARVEDICSAISEQLAVGRTVFPASLGPSIACQTKKVCKRTFDDVRTHFSAFRDPQDAECLEEAGPTTAFSYSSLSSAVCALPAGCNATGFALIELSRLRLVNWSTGRKVLVWVLRNREPRLGIVSFEAANQWLRGGSARDRRAVDLPAAACAGCGCGRPAIENAQSTH